MYAVTGATGHLGKHVINSLLKTVSPNEIVALVRDPQKGVPGTDRGVQVRAFDYSKPETHAPALEGVDRLLLISSSELGQREAQHRAVIEAAKQAGVKFIAYTSILHADTNPLALAVEHRATEALIKASGLSHTFLRNGWYTENYTESAGPAVAHGAWLGSGGEGKISAASRVDYAEAAAIVLAGKASDATYELAGDEAFTEGELAAALAEASGQPVAYHYLPEADYAAALEQVGLPAAFAAILADSSAKSGQGALFDDGRALSRLIGRPTTDWRETVRKAVSA